MSLHGRIWVALALAGGLWGLAGARSVRAGTPPRWNIVLILADDLGWSDLGCYGADFHETPRIDRFAAGAMRFTDAYAAAAICSPTRASIMTGKTPARLHMTIWYEYAKNGPPRDRRLIPPEAVADLPHAEVTLAEVFHQAGYQTFHIGKWHLGDAAHYPETQGFDVNIGGTFWGAPNTYFFPYRGEERYHEFRYVPHLEFGRPGEYLTDRLGREAVRVLEHADRSRPFFLNLCFHAVHTPIEARPDRLAYFKAKLQQSHGPLKHRNPAYAAMVRGLDENVGRVLDKIEALGVADRTIVIFASDNGGVVHRSSYGRITDNAPLRSGKGSLYEGGVRVPLMIRWPGVTRPGAVCREPVITCDFYPTLLEIAGLRGDANHNRHLDGRSLVPLLRHPEARVPPRDLYFHYPHYYPTTTPVSAIRSGPWKLLHYYEDDHLELYNLSRDLSETHNLAESYTDKAAELRYRLEQWLKAVGAQYPRPNPRFDRAR